MKELQDNFTTVEQSKRLIELGVPRNSADCYRWDFGEQFNIRYSSEVHTIYFDYQKSWKDKIPCWSAGRLIEIYELCAGEYYSHRRSEGDDLVEAIIYKIERAIEANRLQPDIYPPFDVSYLEE